MNDFGCHFDSGVAHEDRQPIIEVLREYVPRLVTGSFDIWFIHHSSAGYFCARCATWNSGYYLTADTAKGLADKIRDYCTSREDDFYAYTT